MTEPKGHWKQRMCPLNHPLAQFIQAAFEGDQVAKIAVTNFIWQNPNKIKRLVEQVIEYKRDQGIE